MTEVISVKFKNRGKVYFFDPHGIAVRTGEKVVVETSRGLELAECVQGNHAVSDETVVQPLRSLARIATQDDLREDSGEISVCEADYEHDLSDVPPELLFALHQSGCCLSALEDALMEDDIIYDK